MLFRSVTECIYGGIYPNCLPPPGGGSSPGNPGGPGSLQIYVQSVSSSGNVVVSGSYSRATIGMPTIWWGDGLSEPPGYLRPKVYTEPKGPNQRLQQITTNLLERMRR